MTKARDIASAIPAPSTVSSAELGYLDGVSSAIQTQLDAKTAKSTLSTTGDIYYASGANTPARLGIGSTGNVLTVASGIPSWSAPSGGLTLVKTQTIGSGVSTVTVSDAFSATYDNYKIIISGGVGSGSSGIHMQLGATTTGYYTVNLYQYTNTGPGTVNVDRQGSYSEFVGMGDCSVNSIGSNIEINMPFLAKPTTISNNDVRTINSDAFAQFARGFLDNTTSYTAFTVFCGSGGTTLTGGTIKVYGYANS